MTAEGDWTNQVKNKIIIAGANGGEFLYAPTTPNPSSQPGLNNLVESVTAVAGTDPFGNATLAGFTTYTWSPGFSIWFAVSHQTDGLYYFTAGTEAGPWTQITRMATVTRLFTPATYLLNIGDGSSGVVVNVQNPLHQALVAVDPTAGSPEVAESWHAMTLVNGWSQQSGNATAAYRLNAQGDVDIQGVIVATTTTRQFATLPAAYSPTAQQPFWVQINAASGGQYWGQCNTNGTLNVQGATVVSTNQVYVFKGVIYLNAPTS